ncbi:hypothetical protein OIU74_006686 [Salix koriyanagi]|uniref:Uncharacterized protein n=1 Tax=Salix koriyanagi TaxID=2511006 RepID=A0A9Q0UEW5_9ROSI|nr:hypothetical protein OIU74_006686 [Salix koriyanagi]
MQNQELRPLLFSNIAKIPGPPERYNSHPVQGGAFFSATLTKAEAFTWQHQLRLSFLADWDSWLFNSDFCRGRADKTSGTEVNKLNYRPGCGILFRAPGPSWVTEYNCQTSTFAPPSK